MQTLNVDEVSQIRVNSRKFGLTQTWENNTKSPCPCYYFCLEPTVRKDTWMRTTSVTVMVIFFESVILKVT